MEYQPEKLKPAAQTLYTPIKTNFNSLKTLTDRITSIYNKDKSKKVVEKLKPSINQLLGPRDHILQSIKSFASDVKSQVESTSTSQPKPASAPKSAVDIKIDTIETKTNRACELIAKDPDSPEGFKLLFEAERELSAVMKKILA